MAVCRSKLSTQRSVVHRPPDFSCKWPPNLICSSVHYSNPNLMPPPCDNMNPSLHHTRTLAQHKTPHVLLTPFPSRLTKRRHFHLSLSAKRKSFVTVSKISTDFRKRNTVQTNTLRQQPEKPPMQNPLNPEVYSISPEPLATGRAKLTRASIEQPGTIPPVRYSKLRKEECYLSTNRNGQPI